MRNGGIWKFSIKKFGTPIAAGPGRENENVGLDGEGTPPAPRGGGGAVAPAFAGLPVPLPVADLPVEPGFELGFCDGVVEVGPCVVWLPVLVVVVVGVLDVVDVLVVGVEVEVVGGGVLVVGGVVVVVCGQLSDTITAPAGNEIVDNGTPSGTGNVKSCAPKSRTVTVHD